MLQLNYIALKRNSRRSSEYIMRYGNPKSAPIQELPVHQSISSYSNDITVANPYIISVNWWIKGLKFKKYEPFTNSSWYCKNVLQYSGTYRGMLISSLKMDNYNYS